MVSKSAQIEQHQKRARRRALKGKARDVLGMLYALRHAPQPETLEAFRARVEFEEQFHELSAEFDALNK